MLNELFRSEISLDLDYRILSAVGSLLALSLLFIVLAIKRFFRGNILTASIQSLSGLSLCLAALLSLSIAMNFYSYGRLTFEQPIVQLTFKKMEEQQFQVDISFENKKSLIAT
ncbi:MAG TPA: hypothetical protein EYQ42_10360 [Thiotrichaceae bacterium]|jgi:hypothetical protein|nr:hypothetical protein [Thiotrichaceae bacterium]HIM08366.1 hypothetical protein [Gammaproteobacteria bacterium]